MTFYATHDHNGYGDISENAHIAAFETETQARVYLISAIELEAEDRVVIRDGQYGDCWIKSLRDPADDDGFLAPLTLEQVSIQRPGQHPGGKCFWTTPRVDVLVAVIQRAD